MFGRLSIICLCVAAAVLSSASVARADGTFGVDARKAPSVFTYARRGFFSGTLIGLGGAYLAARPDGIQGDDYRALVFGTGIGALSGAALGMTLGFIDLSDDEPGRGAIVLRDTVYGAGLGVLAGATTGGLFALKSGDAEDILLGGAIGTLSGAAVGLIVGFIEGPQIVHSPRHRYRASRRPTVGVSATLDAAGERVWTPSLVGRF